MAAAASAAHSARRSCVLALVVGVAAMSQTHAQGLPSPDLCTWAGHCLGDPCVTFNDCDNTWICVGNICAVEGTVPASPSPRPASPSPRPPSPSPALRPSPSPALRPSPSPALRPSPSPALRPSPSPALRPSPSPALRPSPSPVLKPSPSPALRPSPLPVLPSPSPLVVPSPSPVLRPSPSPVLRPSPSPVLRPSPSPALRPSPSPALRPSPSPALRPSPSPALRPSPSPALRPSPSPLFVPSPSPALRPSPSPVLRPSPSPLVVPSPSPALRLPSPSPAALCTWPGHCLGDPCVTLNDCDNTWICVSNICVVEGTVPASPSPVPAPDSPRPASPSPVPVPPASPSPRSSPSPRPPSPSPNARPSPSPLPPTPGACTPGWLPAQGTGYDSWPYPNSPEWSGFNGGLWSGTFYSVEPSLGCNLPGEAKVATGVCSSPPCTPGTFDSATCRFTDAAVAKFKVASVPQTTLQGQVLLGKKLRVYALANPAGPAAAVLVNGLDVCSDADCGGCCTTNAKGGVLIDLEKHAAKLVYGLTDTFNTVTYSGSQVTFSNPSGRLWDVNSAAVSADLCFQVENTIPALVQGLPTDDAGNPVVL